MQIIVHNPSVCHTLWSATRLRLSPSGGSISVRRCAVHQSWRNPSGGRQPADDNTVAPCCGHPHCDHPCGGSPSIRCLRSSAPPYLASVHSAHPRTPSAHPPTSILRSIKSPCPEYRWRVITATGCVSLVISVGCAATVRSHPLLPSPTRCGYPQPLLSPVSW